jgi:hypothetical protein
MPEYGEIIIKTGMNLFLKDERRIIYNNICTGDS